MQTKLRRGEAVYLLGIGAGGHDSGVALVRASKERGIELLVNNEEERFSGKKNCTDFPERSIADLLAQMDRLGIGPRDIDACLASWDYVTLGATGVKAMVDELPGSFRTAFDPDAQDPTMTPDMVHAVMFEAAARLGKSLGLGEPFPIIGMRHHDNHAALAYAMSPFAKGEEPVMVAVLDGSGDDGAVSLYLARSGQLELYKKNRDPADSLGMLYSLISCTQGGWKILQSEGRYMGAAAWGNGDRLTNPYYARLRQILYFGGQGEVLLNRSLANWHRKSFLEPYSQELIDILGPPIPRDRWWNPDAVLNVDDIEHSEITQDRVDKAAALQLVFEDGLFHLLGSFIRETGSSRLVLSGGCALNCVANMRLLDHFDRAFYERYLGQKETRLHLWVPPTPGDSGVTMGAAFNFALAQGAPAGAPLEHAFYCGSAPSSAQVREAVEAVPEMGMLALGDTSSPTMRGLLADLLGYIVAHDGVVGLFQGAAETGPRALGHRSILANPCNPKTLEVLNALVKYRERIRPLAPMATLEGALRWFELSEGASDRDYNAYRYMILTARARPEAYATIPAVIHKDGTARVQIVDEAQDPFTYAYLKAMGRRTGAEVSVNTSLNVASPIVQTPVQALEALRRSKAMDGLFMVGADGHAFLVWHDIKALPKDGGKRLLDWVAGWQNEVGERAGIHLPRATAQEQYAP
ncbi:carbamoyltransferase C-terminal domain-containing protein [Pendulispora albinea]|uniref:Carbamoyltransferase n=1 Tax=Pendulispora albinea TaxID=2741071 RepID=A0ABZ2M3P8_9BACT